MISKLIQHVLSFFTCQQSNSLCIVILYNGGSKAPIRLLGRGRSCLIEKLVWNVWTNMVLKEIHLAYSTRFLFREQDLYLETWSQSPLICTEKAFGSGYIRVTLTHVFCYFCLLCKHLSFSPFFHYFLFIYMFPFCLHATGAFYKRITIFFCIIKPF